MKPVFGDKEREERNTTISRVEDVVEEVGKKKTPNMVTKEEAENMVLHASEQAVNTALERYDSRRREEESRRIKEIEAEREAEIEAKRRRRKEDEEDTPIVSSKTVKDLQNIASIFNSLKEFSANPLQKAIEGKVGDVAAGVVERAFTPHPEPQKKDIVDQILNSQFAAGLGAGLGQRGPELVDTFTKNFGKDKVDGWISGAVGMGGGMGSIGELSGIPGQIGGQTKQQSEVEMILSLDPNNSEHVSAYAHSQGDISVDTARKILMIHQDDFIRQLDLKGVDTMPYKLRRNQEKEMSNQEIDNSQEYRRPPPRINDDLIVNTPIAEDKRWEKEDVSNVPNATETQNIDLHPEMERIEPDKVNNPNDSNPGGNNPGGNAEIMTYLKNLSEQLKLSNDSIIGLRQELDVLKRDRMLPDDMIKDKDVDIIKKDKTIPEETTVRSMKNITNSKVSKQGYRFVKEN